MASEDAELATYDMECCQIHCLVFDYGSITFSEYTLELDVVIDDYGLLPLVLAYESLESFTISRECPRIHIAAPSDVVMSWAEMNALTFDEPLVDSQCHAEFLISPEDLSSLKSKVAPMIAANRRARSSSRWSATELLPLKPFTVQLASQSVNGVQTESASKQDKMPAVEEMYPLPQDIATHLETQDPGAIHSTTVRGSVSPHTTPLATPVAKDLSCNLSSHAILQHSAPSPLYETPHEEAVRLPRRKQERRSHHSQISSASTSPSASAAPKKRGKIRLSVAPKKILIPNVSGCNDDDNEEEDDVPLGQLLFSSAVKSSPTVAVVIPSPSSATTCRKSEKLNSSDAARCSTPHEHQASQVKYDFCDISSPNHMKTLTDIVSATTKQRSSGRASKLNSGRKSGRGDVPVEASVGAPKSEPRSSTRKSKGSVAEPVPACGTSIEKTQPPPPAAASLRPCAEPKKNKQQISGVEVTDPEHMGEVEAPTNTHPIRVTHDAFAHEPQHIRLPTPSVARTMTSVAPPRAPLRFATSDGDSDALTLKSLLERGVDEDNLETFLKSASRMGKRLKDAKRKREESAMRTQPLDLSDLARCTSQLLMSCAKERNERRAKFFRYYSTRGQSLLQQSQRYQSDFDALSAKHNALQQELREFIESLTSDEPRWNHVEDLDVQAAIQSIRDKLLLSAKTEE